MLDIAELLRRVEGEGGVDHLGRFGPAVSAGFFNKFRPSGSGIERILAGDPVADEVRKRTQHIFDATVDGWTQGDFYFIPRKVAVLSLFDAKVIVERFVEGMKLIAATSGDDDAFEYLKNLEVIEGAPDHLVEDEDGSIMMYECLTDFLAKMQPERHALFLLKEAFYSMASDYLLMMYILFPAIQDPHLPDECMDSYFDIWRFRIKFSYFVGGKLGFRVGAA